MTERERLLLWMLMEFDINRYLMTINRGEGNERAQRHMNISEMLCQFVLTKDNVDHSTVMVVHDFLSELMTDRLDETIGFPINRSVIGTEYNVFAEKFFNYLYQNIHEIEKIAKDSENAIIN